MEASKRTIVVVGGGAAGFFAAIAAKSASPAADVILLEKTQRVLSKVRVSGGGRCNVTHSCFDPRLLSQRYPRGGKELIGPFNRFQPKDTVEWFASRGVELKSEEDGRMFPVTDSSSTIIDCLQSETERVGVDIRLGQRISSIVREEENYRITLASGTDLCAERLLLATGSAQQGHRWAESIGHSIQEPVPSLFTFNIPDFSLKGLEGLSVNPVEIRVEGFAQKQSGPILVTHWGLSGPAVLKLSAWAARDLHHRDYHFETVVDWLPSTNREELQEQFQQIRINAANQQIGGQNKRFGLPQKLWRRMLEMNKIDPTTTAAHLSKKAVAALLENLKSDRFQVSGKTTNKEEFVTCGGVILKEVNFRTMESRKSPGLYFAGEILDIDGVTGGFNFQNAWTTAWIAGNAMQDYPVA